VRLSVVLLLCALAGILGGGALLGLPALGACLIFDSLLVGGYGLLTHDWSVPPQPVTHEIGQTLEQIFARAEQASWHG
jgi:hypothetical protein